MNMHRKPYQFPHLIITGDYRLQRPGLLKTRDWNTRPNLNGFFIDFSLLKWIMIANSGKQCQCHFFLDICLGGQLWGSVPQKTLFLQSLPHNQ